MFRNRRFEKLLAGVSLSAAIGLAYTALLISEDDDIAAGVCLVIAQFCTLTATLLGLDYKFNGTNINSPRNTQQQPAQSPNL